MRRLALLIAFVLGSMAAAQNQKVVVRKLPGETYYASYDPAHVSEQDVRRWIELSPEVSHFNFYLVPESLEMCASNFDPAYEPCSKNEDEINVHNARHTLDLIRRRMNDLDPARYPPELRQVVLYFREIQRVALWEETKRFEFWRTGDLDALESEYNGINPAVDCGPILDRIAHAQSRDEAAKLAHYDWWPCVMDAEWKAIGDYPEAAWEKFLADHGIRERVVEEDTD